TAGDQAGYQGGLHVFSSSIVALLAASRSGVGDHIDLSLQEIQAASLEGFGPNAMVRGLDAERAGNQARATWGIYPCADGHVGVSAMRRQTPIVYECIGHPELAEDPAFLNILADPQNNELVQALVLEWTASRTQAEIYEESGRLRAPFAVVETPETLLASEHLQHTGFWSETPHPIFGTHTLPGVPFKIDGVRPPQRRAPLPGEHTGDVLFEWFDDDEDASAPPDAGPVSPPLEGIRVLDLTQVWAGPYAARFLADMGADVIHIEGPDFPDAVRGVGRSEEERSCDTSPYFNEYNRNKRGIVLDLNRPEGIDAFKRMVRNSDVVMENWSVGVAERLGIGYEELRALNPRLIFVQMPAFGCEGPEAERVGFGPNIEQMGGLVSLQGYEGAEPHKSGISYGDPNGGTLTAGVIAAALFRRDRTREGAHVVVIQRENIVGMIGEYVVARSLGYELPSRLGNRHPDRAPHGVYRTRDDSGRHGGLLPSTEVQYHETWLALDVQTDKEWESLKLLLGDARLDDALVADAAGRTAAVGVIDAIVGQWARDRDPNETAAELQAAGIAASPVPVGVKSSIGGSSRGNALSGKGWALPSSSITIGGNIDAW
ncbi:MAG: CoA transferase, partial [Dehalococcoidia bacterium]